MPYVDGFTCHGTLLVPVQRTSLLQYYLVYLSSVPSRGTWDGPEDGRPERLHARLLFLARVLLARAARKDINRIHDPRMRVRAPSTVLLLTNSVCTYVSTYLR